MVRAASYFWTKYFWTKGIDHADYLITLARLSVIDWLAGPMPDTSPRLMDIETIRQLCEAIEFEPLSSPAGLPTLGPADDHVDTPRASAATD
jgi:hypothetical protein